MCLTTGPEASCLQHLYKWSAMCCSDFSFQTVYGSACSRPFLRTLFVGDLQVGLCTYRSRTQFEPRGVSWLQDIAHCSAQFSHLDTEASGPAGCPFYSTQISVCLARFPSHSAWAESAAHFNCSVSGNVLTFWVRHGSLWETLPRNRGSGRSCKYTNCCSTSMSASEWRRL